MNVKIGRAIGLVLLGAVLIAVPELAYAQDASVAQSNTAEQTSVTPTRDEIQKARLKDLQSLRDKQGVERSLLRVNEDIKAQERSDIRDGRTFVGQVNRYLSNAERARNIRDYRDDERSDLFWKRFGRNVLTVLNRSFTQWIREDARAELYADNAIRHTGFCWVDENGFRECYRGTETLRELQAQEEERAILREGQQEIADILAEERSIMTDVQRDIRDARTSTNAADSKALRDGRIAEGNRIRTIERNQAQAIYDRRIARNEATNGQSATQIARNAEADRIRKQGTDAAKAIYDERIAANEAKVTPEADAITAETIGQAITSFGNNLIRFPSLFYIMSYVCGVYFMAMGLVKANRSAIEPSRNPISDAVKFMVAGMFLSALPITTSAIQKSLGFANTKLTLKLEYEGLGPPAGTTPPVTPQGLDQFIVSLVTDIAQPVLSMVVMVAIIMGVFLFFQGLQRLVKGSQEGPKGPAGLGTIMHFVVGAALLSFVPTFELVLNSTFGTNDILTNVNMSAIATGIGTEEANLAQAKKVFTALLAFLAIIGTISFARGLFMLKDAADGAQNASLMGSMSHIIAGVCCVNFGAFANLLQNTLGLRQFGVLFN